MKYHIYPLSFKKYSLMLVCPFLLLALLIWSMEARFEPLNGDLTRLGYLLEEDFGWNMQQPLVPVEHLKSFSIEEADVLVIGDSFSAGLIWQSRLVSEGLKPATLYWKALLLCEDIGTAVRRAGFRGRYMVIESVERSFQKGMSYSCDKTINITKNAYTGSVPVTDRPKSPSAKNPLGGEWMIKALYNKIKLSKLNTSQDFIEFGRVRTIPIDGCKLFTNKMCEYGLFYSKDFKKKTYSATANVLAVNRNLQKVGIQTIWLVVPDKSTVYLGFGKYNKNPYVNIWQELAQYKELTVPNLDEKFIRESQQVKDFYAPNNTHLSTSGYLFLGDMVVNYVKNMRKIDDNLNFPKDFSTREIRQDILN